MEVLVNSLTKLVKYLFVITIVIGLGIGVFCTSMVFRGCGSESRADTCQQYIDGKPNLTYRQEWFSCWRQCSPKQPKINAKTCECTCFDKLEI